MATRRPKPKAAAARVEPTVAVQAVDELPHYRDPRTDRYRVAMAEVRKKGRGKWFQVATFESPNGAADVRRAITRRERPIDGKLTEWEIESRRLRDDRGDVIGSGLFVKLK